MGQFSFQNSQEFSLLRLGPTAKDTLQEFIDIDVTTDDLARILRRNKSYRDLFARYVIKKTGMTLDENNKQGPSTHRIIALLGLMASRNLILSLRMHKAIEKTFPFKGGEVEIRPEDYLKRANTLEEVFLQARWPYAETAFSASVYYDWLYRGLSKNSDFKKLEPYFDHVWKRAQKVGTIAYHLAHEVPGANSKQALASGILLPAGKIWMALQDSSYAEKDQMWDTNPLYSPLALKLMEEEKWQTSFETVSAHSLYYFDIFESSIPAIQCYREPYLGKAYSKGTFQLSTILYLADLMARSWKIPADEKDAVFSKWDHPNIKSLKLSAAKIIKVMKASMGQK